MRIKVFNLSVLLLLAASIIAALPPGRQVCQLQPPCGGCQSGTWNSSILECCAGSTGDCSACTVC